VEGTVKGTINVTADVYVEAKGTVEAEVTTRNIEIRGTLTGNSDRFELMPEGKMDGDVSAPRVVIADGAKFKGKIDMPQR
jgi:cytoskeletal protein CcmA (bactofilin family)